MRAKRLRSGKRRHLASDDGGKKWEGWMKRGTRGTGDIRRQWDVNALGRWSDVARVTERRYGGC